MSATALIGTVGYTRPLIDTRPDHGKHRTARAGWKWLRAEARGWKWLRGEAYVAAATVGAVTAAALS
jgi:hypothetical protein